MEPQLPTVTVVIPNHNYAEWLPMAVDSVIAQDYPNKQIIVIDDNSTDKSKEVVPWLFEKKQVANGASHIMKGERLGVPLYGVMLSKEGGGFGPSYARNVGIKALWNPTQIFMFLDADDYWLQGKMSKSVSKMLEAPDRIGVVYTDNYGLNVVNNQMSREYRHSYDRNKLLRNCIVHSGSAVSKLALKVCGLYDESMRTAEDWDLWIRISRDFMFYHIPEPLVVARHGTYNSTNSVSPEVWQKNWQKIAARIREVYEQTV